MIRSETAPSAVLVNIQYLHPRNSSSKLGYQAYLVHHFLFFPLKMRF
jgi:hypothetical protein